MPHDPMKFALPVIVAAAILVACAPSTPTADSAATAASGVCDRAAAEHLAGQAGLTDAEATRLTGASIVRQIAPGQQVHQNYTDARITIETDPATGRVVRAYCG